MGKFMSLLFMGKSLGIKMMFTIISRCGKQILRWVDDPYYHLYKLIVRMTQVFLCSLNGACALWDTSFFLTEIQILQLLTRSYRINEMALSRHVWVSTLGTEGAQTLHRLDVKILHVWSQCQCEIKGPYKSWLWKVIIWLSKWFIMAQ